MKFNLQLKKELNRYEAIVDAERSKATPPVCEEDEKSQPPKLCYRTSEKVVGGEIIWRPIDRTAAMLLAKAPWWAYPPQDPKPRNIEPKKKKARKRMAQPPLMNSQLEAVVLANKDIPVSRYAANGEPLYSLSEIHAIVSAEIEKWPTKFNPHVQAAEGVRKIINELLHGVGSDMVQFNTATKGYLEDIRQTRFAVVTETAGMTKELKDVRQFFLGSDYKEQITRLREFVELCERLQKLKECGFLDSVADTILRLSEK